MGDISRINDLSAPQFSVGPRWKWIAQTDRNPVSWVKEKTVSAVRGAETNAAHPQSAALEKKGATNYAVLERRPRDNRREN